MNKILKDKSGGATIMITVIIMTTILTVALSLGSVVTNGLKVSVNQANATQAYFAAESGAEEYLWQVRKRDPVPFNPVDLSCDSTGTYISNDWSGCNTTLDNLTKFGDPLGLFHYIRYSTTTTETIIGNYGEYKGTRRAVRLTY